MDRFEIHIATPRRQVLSAEVRQAEIPAAGGQLGVLPDHAPLLASLGTGVLSLDLYEGGERKRLLVSGGFLQVLPERTLVLADLAEFPEEIDAAAARSALEQAELANRHAGPESDPVELQRQLALAKARVELAS